MNKLAANKRLTILNMLIAGQPMSSISRTVEVSVNTVAKLLADVGEACRVFHESIVSTMAMEHIQYRDTWSYSTPSADVWTWTAMDTDSQLMFAWGVSDEGELPSSKRKNHLHMLSLYFVYYNFCCIHEALQITPAMKAGLSVTQHDMEWITGLLDAHLLT